MIGAIITRGLLADPWFVITAGLAMGEAAAAVPITISLSWSYEPTVALSWSR